VHCGDRGVACKAQELCEGAARQCAAGSWQRCNLAAAGTGLIPQPTMENMSEFELQLAALPEDFIIWHYKVCCQYGLAPARRTHDQAPAFLGGRDLNAAAQYCCFRSIPPIPPIAIQQLRLLSSCSVMPCCSLGNCRLTPARTPTNIQRNPASGRTPTTITGGKQTAG
jgi:hypothetical protein